MTVWMFAIMAVVMFASIVFYVRAFAWIMSKGSSASQLLVALASIAFCLVMAKCNVDQDMFYAVVFLATIPFYLWLAFRAFNKLVPTKEEPHE